VIAVALLSVASAGTWACGFHKPETIAQGLLEWNYPDALHVDGAVWAGQQAGVLPMPDRRQLQASGTERKMLDTRAYLAALRALHALGAGFDQRNVPDDASSGKAVLLLETMLWTRFPAGGEVEPHVTGPEPGDLVVVTDDPVVGAIADGRLNLAEAMEQGFIRLYGTPEQERDFLERFGDLGDEPLPPMDARKLLSGVRSGQR
jgi:hypothetical protein